MKKIIMFTMICFYCMHVQSSQPSLKKIVMHKIANIMDEEQSERQDLYESYKLRCDEAHYEWKKIHLEWEEALFKMKKARFELVKTCVEFKIAYFEERMSSSRVKKARFEVEMARIELIKRDSLKKLEDVLGMDLSHAAVGKSSAAVSKKDSFNDFAEAELLEQMMREKEFEELRDKQSHMAGYDMKKAAHEND